ncbi:MAG TPA: maleylpyruvate isomerase family mycothiol-dependent enzyme [Nocardioides sp.]|uniref:maleylpyruvate isomerase family mycothiol-dependent enzyme n=1 Tax=uncultured Nocardioides sp. TaxID=198441 RepID=UPI002613C782|nr:maleylpyruvate isomerase family mycothiol-dependent enzyme [uncultured Nocardioides sp.]HRD62703.1 maleylpyruvate isomerase family mycothiol-dependent enzyme [Nocardioides sp.]HRI97555.1 maleylpyruvate isomerase family mycothiol-dependent enzyme [Nocardioides sp.]
MPTQLTIARHLDGLQEAMHAFLAHARRAGLDAPVPTCPDWTVLDLIAHQGMVHRWACALVRGVRPDDETVEGYAAQGRSAGDPLAWLAEGAEELHGSLAAAPEDLETFVFLNDAPPPRDFWARRQCHETSMHAVDALAAALGRPPRPDEVWIDAELAGDGIDELLAGFLTRPRSRLRCEEEAVLVVRPVDLPDWWEVSMGPRPAVTTRRTAADLLSDEPDWELTGGAVELYVRLWNRTDPPEDWRRLTAITWS